MSASLASVSSDLATTWDRTGDAGLVWRPGAVPTLVARNRPTTETVEPGTTVIGWQLRPVAWSPKAAGDA